MYELKLELLSNKINDGQDKVLSRVHHSLVGNPDYIESNIVLAKSDEVTHLLIDIDDCKNSREYLRAKAKEAIDIYFDSLEKEENRR